MGMILVFLLNTGLNFLLGLAVAAVLGPAEYGRYAVAFTVALVIMTGLFEWLRLSATRYYSDASRRTDPALRATLEAGFIGVAAALLLAAALAGGLGGGGWIEPALVGATAVAGIAMARFELDAAYARTRFLDRTYALLVGLKSTLSFALVVGAAWLWRDTLWVLVGLAAACILATLPARGLLRDRGAGPKLFERSRLLALARYGVPIVAANVFYQLILLANRSEAAAAFGLAEAGRLALATDLGLRLIVAVGAALDTYLFQLAVRRADEAGEAAGREQIARNIVLIAAALMPLMVGYALVLPAFEALLVAPDFRGSYTRLSLILVPGFLAFGLLQFALGPVFQLAGRTAPLIGAAGLALLLDLALLAVKPASWGAAGTAGIHSISLIAGFAIATALAVRLQDLRSLAGPLLRVTVATAGMALVVWPSRSVTPPALFLVVAVAAGSLSYIVFVVVLNVAGCRDGLMRRRSTRLDVTMRQES